MTTSSETKTRVLMAKPGLDVHDRGALLVSKALRDEGVEVIYSGLWQTTEMIVTAAIEEDVDAIAISLLDGQPSQVFGSIMNELKKRGRGDIYLFAGGTAITDAVKPQLQEIGVHGLHGPGTPLDVVIKDMIKILDQKGKS